MNLRPLSKAIAISLCGASFFSFASHIEVMTITASQQKLANDQDTAIGSSIKPDLAGWLDSVPGATVNRNGPVTGVAQYRGLFGDRVAIAVDGHTLIGAGPNAMDAPMSYVTPLIVESMSLYRGIAPVSAGIDTLGGSININMRKADISNSSEVGIEGAFLTGYREQNEADTLATWFNINKDNQALMVFANQQTGENYEDGDGREVTPTYFDKRQAGLDYRIELDGSEFGISYHYSDTHDSGSPAIFMDIDFIYGNRVNIDGKFKLADWNVKWVLGYLDSIHGMDNFSKRPGIAPAMQRYNYATANTTDFKVHIDNGNEQNLWKFGIDGYLADHDSTITNPSNAMFEIGNFNDVKDNRIGIFAEWQGIFGDSTYSLGGRIKHIEADAGEVSNSMAAMNMMVASLVDGMNNADRRVTDTNYDIALNLRHTYDQQVSVYAGFGIKQRSPSYQERYLWMPLEATGGLADGKTYVGNINLDEETAYQLDLGLNYENGSFFISPHVYYQRIDDYIQGTSATDPAVKMVANAMFGDANPLIFSNLDAELYGMDLRWYYQLNANWQVSGLASYVRGKRRDVSDNLYRIAPPSVELALSYQANSWKTQVELKAFTHQDDVSAINEEQESAGYGVVNWSLDYYFDNDFTVRAGVDNLFDRQYASHLSGYNRIQNVEVPHMSRLPGEGANAWVELGFQF
jgi:iron complex outermembrane receptor protein